MSRITASHRRRALLAAVLLALPAAGPQVSRSEPKASEAHQAGSRSEPKASEVHQGVSRSEPKASEAHEEPRDTAQPPTLEALMRGMAGASGVVARFREEKRLALLSEPLESRGTLYFVPPNRLSRETSEPSQTRLVIDGDRFFFRDAAGSEAMDLSASPIAREYVGNFIVLFNGDLDALRRRYEPEFHADAKGWRLALRPRAKPLSEFIERVTLEGRGRALERMELIEAGGDRTTTWFEAVRTDRAFSAEELARIFSEPSARER